jgi:tRNA threonylcarbamoyladenosine biosynthesis protein TsaE
LKLVERVTTATAAETEAAGRRAANALRPGDVVLIEGDLGSGKTTFVRGAARALGVTGRVTSPTFAIGHRYNGTMPVSHLDLYRLDGLEREEAGLLADYLTPAAVAFVEWPAGAETELARLGRVAMIVRLEHAGGDRRQIEILSE